MFPPGNEGIDMNRLLQQAQQMQEKLMSAQHDMSEAEATGTAGGGLVQATVTGTGELTGLQLDPSVVDPDDVDTLADLVVAAVRDAHTEIQRRAQEQMGDINADVAGLLGGAGAEGSPLAGLFGGAGAISGDTVSAQPAEDDETADDTDDGRDSGGAAPGSTGS
ncbi:hypothetical protein CLV30_104206 [Haloactinopolyspora alba]|uniref:Nucleoid-associated protein CLV30_104206 n=1 Tax=Haloactinopolyspora alba TaxID=648780 RepID=A0A2P8E7B3_9ACTN|nr:YbaB/EbfC family nucleoid-associated protein [Haloactinopolyspora alba]PSL05337.1 hypothetical protein CLV30_104206 [Haloactinopolyspora alba]